MCGQAEDTGKAAPRGRCGLDFKHRGQLHGRQRVMPDLLLGDKASVTQGHHGLGDGEGRKQSACHRREIMTLGTGLLPGH